MNLAFYTAAVGAGQQQRKLDIVSNNIANVNTEGYKTQNTTFVDMLYGNIRDREGNQTDLTVGIGAQIEKTDIDFSSYGVEPTDNIHDFAIVGDGFFAVYNADTEQISYTRKGIFHMSEYGENIFYLTLPSGEFVLDSKGQAIRCTFDPAEEYDIGVYDFNNYQGMLSVGDELYRPVEKNGQPFLNTNASLMRGYVEKSNVSLSDEMVKVIEAQRVYQANLRMISTSDEIEQTLNGLR